MISVPGIGSGLDIGSLIAQLVAVEGNAKSFNLSKKRSSVTTEISAFGSLKSSLTNFKNSIAALKTGATFSSRKLTSSDTDIFTATGSGRLAISKYDIEVLEFAEAHKLITSGYADSDTEVGTGSLTISVGNAAFTVTIGSASNTLTGIRDAINDASDNTGVSASIANVDDGSGGTETKLILSANATGTDNSLSIVVNDDDGMDTDSTGLSAFYYDTSDGTSPEQMVQLSAAVDAQITIDGQTVTSSTNEIKDAIQGITITLLKKDPGNIHTLAIALDTAAVKSAVTTFISSYNSLNTAINALTDLNVETRQRGALLGNRTVLTLTNQLRRELANSVDIPGSSLSNLVELGITTAANGSLKLDSSTLDDLLKTDLDAVKELFTSTDGIATRFDAMLNDYVKAGGVIDAKTTGLDNTIKKIDRDFVKLNRRLESLEQRLTKQFTALDGLLSRLQQTSRFLDTQLSAIEKISINYRNR